MTSTLLLVLLGLHGALAKGFPKIKMETFQGTLTVSANFTGIAPFNDTTDVETSVFAGIRSKLLLLLSTKMPDGRSSVTITDFKGKAMYEQMPFYNESVCYKLPIPVDETIHHREMLYIAILLFQQHLFSKQFQLVLV